MPGGAQSLVPPQASEPEAAAETAESAADPLATLLDVLRDDSARAALVSQLEEQVSADLPEDAADADADGLASVEKGVASLGGRIALITQDIAQTAASRAIAAWQSVQGAGSVFDGFQGGELSVLLDAGRTLLLVLLLTVASFLSLRAVCIPLFKRMGKRASNGSLVGRTLRFVLSLVIDAAIVLVAWAIGYAVATLVLGEFGQIGLLQTLYLNAFLMVEMVKVVIRAVLSPSAAGLRPIPLNNAEARHVYRLANVVVSIMGYGQLLIVPIMNQNISTAAGLAVSALLSVIVLLYLAGAVILNRAAVADWLHRRMAPPPPPPAAEPAAGPEDGVALADPDPAQYRARGFTGSLVRHWHWFALAYLGFMFVVVMSQPTETVMAYLAASGKIALAVLVATLVTGAIASTISDGIFLPEDVTRKLPLLQPRLNRFVPRLLLVVRYVVGAIVVLFILDTIGLIRLRGWMESQMGLAFTGALISVFLVLLVAYAIWLAMTSWVDFRLNPDYGSIPTAREKTLLTLMRNAATITILVLTLMFCLAEIGLNIGPLLASAGVLGLAIGFGAQKMVQDIITGVFIQFENAINVGDVITVGGTTGTVEKLTVRSVSLRDLNGVFHIIPFSSVDMVSNYTRDFSYFLCDMGVAYRENVSEVKQAMLDGFDELRGDPAQNALITGDLEWFGLNSFGDSAVVCRARIKTLPGSQWGVGRAYNEILKRIFDARGIEIPFPHQTIFFGEAKDGTTQPIRIADAGDSREESAPARPAGPPAGTADAPVDTRRATDADDKGNFDDR